MKKFAVVVTHNRHTWCRQLVAQLLEQNTTVVVVDNNSLPPFEWNDESGDVFVEELSPDPFNLSELWNHGLDTAEFIHQARGGGEWVVGVFNDDVSIPSNFMDRCTEVLCDPVHDVAVAFPDQHNVDYTFINEAPPAPTVEHHLKMTGFAHVTRGWLGMRFDESMPVWYADNDYEMQARLLGGTAMVGRLRVEHMDANGNFSRNPAWQIQAGIDRETFRTKWGFDAWL